MELLAVLQKVTQNCMDAADLMNLEFGTVKTAAPLSIETQSLKILLPAEALELTYAVADHYVDFTLDHETRPAGFGELRLPHSHTEFGRYTETAAPDHVHPESGGQNTTGQPVPTAEHSHYMEETQTSVVDPAEGADLSNTEHIHKVEGRWRFLVHNGLAAGEKVVMLKASGGQKYIVLSRVVSGNDYSQHP
jgi:hypothetical protein